MTSRIKKQAPALKHGAFSAMTILPGESAAEFKKLQQEVISELTPDGALEADAVSTLAHLLWRRQNLATFRNAELARQRLAQIRAEMVPNMDDGEPKRSESVEFEKTLIDKWNAAESQAREELGDLYALVEMGEEATIDGLLKYLTVVERLDAMVDKGLKRLLMLKGIKSLSFASTSDSGGEAA
jgi:hypothetical protein